jgi:hypothetical protein
VRRDGSRSAGGTSSSAPGVGGGWLWRWKVGGCTGITVVASLIQVRVASHWDHRLGQRRGGERGVERNSWEGEVERQRRWEVEAEEPRRHGGRAWKEAGRAGRTRAEGVHGLLHRLRRTVWFVGYEINGVKRGQRIKVE